MKNRLKGTTLVETVLYIAILTTILFVIVSFTLSTSEATMRTERRAHVYSASEFITQHLDYIFSRATGINETKSSFNQDNGMLYINIGNEEHYYSLSSNKLVYDGTEMNTKDILIKKFHAVPVHNKKEKVVGVRVTLEIESLRDQKVKKEVNTLYTVR